MIKRIIILTILFNFFLPVLADEVNMTPQNTFSGYNNNGIKPKYPKLQSNLNMQKVNTVSREDIMKPKSVREMGEVNLNTQSMYDKFPQNYDSSNMMIMQNLNNGIQNLVDY